MRLMFSLILTSFFFLAYQQSKSAAVVGKEWRQTIKDKHSNSNLSGQSQHKNLSKAILQNNHHSSTNHSRPLSEIQAGAGTAFLSPVSDFLHTHFLAPPYNYCTSIGLKLLFPKHYFW